MIEKVVRGKQASVDAAIELGISKRAIQELVEEFVSAGHGAVKKHRADHLPPLGDARGGTLERELNRLAKARRDGSWPTDARLRACQVDAFETMRVALTEFAKMGSRDVAGVDDRGHYVIQMATGAGKTGVMACCAFALPDVSRCLIVVPSDALRAQLQRELTSDPKQSDTFWAKTRLRPAQERSVKLARGSELDAVRPKPGTIVVTTIQSLHARYAATSDGAARKELLEELRKFDLVMFDEGHRKPATAWDLAIEDLQTPTVLLTATPYRADGKSLRARPIFSFTLTDAMAVPATARFLRGVEFAGLDLAAGQTSAYVDALVVELNAVTKPSDGVEHRPRIIVRGGSGAEVDELLGHFRAAHAAGRLPTAPAAVHSRFKAQPDEGRYRSAQTIPSEAQVLIHEDILLEGYDDPRVLLIALPSMPNDSTVLVQQVGRALRWKREWDPARQQVARILVPRPSSDTDAVWATYQRYERNPDAYEVREGAFWPSSGRLADLDEKDLLGMLRVRPSVRIFRAKKKLAPGEAAAELKRWLPVPPLRAVAMTQEVDGSEMAAAAVIFEQAKRPDFLLGGYEDSQLGLICLVEGRKHVFVAATEQSIVSNHVKWVEIEVDQLFSLVPSNGNVQSVRLRNLDTSEGTIRAKSLTAERSERHVSTVRDGGFVAQSLGWWNDAAPSAPRERASASSMTFGSATRLSLEQFLTWCAGIEGRLEAPAATQHEIMTRVAARTSSATVTPYLLRIDFDDEVESLQLARLVSGRWLPSGAPFVPEGTTVFAELARSSADPKHWVGRLALYGTAAIPELPQVKVAAQDDPPVVIEWAGDVGLLIRRDGENENLLRWAREKRRCVVMANDGVVFSQGALYKKAAPSADYIRATVLASPLFDRCTTEVARGTGGAVWDPDCVFARIEKAIQAGPPSEWSGFDLVICDDAANEAADYLAFQFSSPMPRIVMMHAKCSHPSPEPGKAPVFKRLQIRDLYVVLGQATKNAHFLWASPDQEQLQRWKGQHAKGNCPRVRRGAVGDLSKISALIRNPQTRREVWVIQSMLEARQLLAEAAKAPASRSKNTARMLQLIEHTASAVGSQGASFRLFGNDLK